MILFDTTDFFHKLYFYTIIYIFFKGKKFFYFIFLVVISFHLLTRCCKILSIIESKIVKQFFFKLVIAEFFFVQSVFPNVAVESDILYTVPVCLGVH